MGFWSTSLYGNDLTLDVRDKLDDLLKKWSFITRCLSRNA